MVHYKQSLRFRITVSFVLFATILSSAIAVGVYFAVEDIEDELIDERVKSELEYVLRRGNVEADVMQKVAMDTQFYYLVDEQTQLLPSELKALPMGLHEWASHDKSAYVLVSPYEQGRTYLIKEATEFENREEAIQLALVIMVVMSILVALWLGRWLSGKVISPVANLAAHVERLSPSAEASSHIALNYAQDEVGQLAATFDQYMNQIQQFIQREQDFTADASHELRTPLAVIRGAAELLLETAQLNERQLKQVQRIERAAERMSQMLEILLMLAREMPSQRQASMELISVQDVLFEAIEQLRFLLNNKELEIKTEIINDCHVAVSKSILLMVVSNLLKNAIEHTDQGEIFLQLKGAGLLISDTGHGIAEEDQCHVFERFYRGKDGLQGGSGIGLSLVKRICDRQGWNIVLHSQLGQGTRVSIDFGERM